MRKEWLNVMQKELCWYRLYFRSYKLSKLIKQKCLIMREGGGQVDVRARVKKMNFRQIQFPTMWISANDVSISVVGQEVVFRNYFISSEKSALQRASCNHQPRPGQSGNMIGSFAENNLGESFGEVFEPVVFQIAFLEVKRLS